MTEKHLSNLVKWKYQTHHHSKQKGALHNSPSEQYQHEISIVFSSLGIGTLLHKAGIRKAFSVSSLAVFKIIFLLVFQGRNLFRLLESKREESLPGKDVVYRFLNETRFNWRRFFQSLSLKIVSGFEKLISSHRIRVFIIDDSILNRKRSKKVELLAKVFDHVSGHFIRGYNLLTLGWSDGYSFAPIDFTLMSSAKKANRFHEKGMFYLFADEVDEIDSKTALFQLMVFVQELLKIQLKKNAALHCQLQKWISELPSYIKGLFSIPGRESCVIRQIIEASRLI